VAALAPLVHIDHKLPDLKLVDEAWPLEFTGDGVTVVLSVTPEGHLHVRIDGNRLVEGPVVRVFGPLEQGLFAGLEYLGKGEHSSSKLDIETVEHLRVEPDPMKVTMPLMAVVTDEATIGMSWDDMTLQPVFAAPDFLDGAPGHRMALKGKTVDAVIRVGSGWKEDGRLESAIFWAVNRHGLPTFLGSESARPANIAESTAIVRPADAIVTGRLSWSRARSRKRWLVSRGGSRQSAHATARGVLRGLRIGNLADHR
jgi:hypothetical protein